LRDALKAYNPNVRLSIDVFGEVAFYGSIPEIGQNLYDIAKYFEVIAPMAYPSHYRCGEFGVKDPNQYPYIVYKKTLASGLKFLQDNNLEVEIRPWIQNFSLASIYNCGPFVNYGPDKIRLQIQAAEDLNIFGFMLWNAGSNYIKSALHPKLN